MGENMNSLAIDTERQTQQPIEPSIDDEILALAESLWPRMRGAGAGRV